MKKIILFLTVFLIAINAIRTDNNKISLGSMLEYMSKTQFDFTDTIEAVIEMGNSFEYISTPLDNDENMLTYIGRTFQAIGSVINVGIKAVQDIVQSLAQILDFIMYLINPNYQPNKPNSPGGGGGGGGSRPA